MVFPLWRVLPAERLQLFSCGKTWTLVHCLSVLLGVQKQVVHSFFTWNASLGEGDIFLLLQFA